MPNADVAKLVDALLSGGSALGCEGSNPFIRTLEESRPLSLLFFMFFKFKFRQINLAPAFLAQLRGEGEKTFHQGRFYRAASLQGRTN
jgi:hypothetical protein